MLSPSLSFHHCVFCLSATFQVCSRWWEFQHCQPLRILSCTVSFFIVSHCVIASLPLFRSVPATRISPLAAFKNFVMHCLLLYHFITVFFASLPLFRSVPTVRIHQCQPLRILRILSVHCLLLYHFTIAIFATVPLSGLFLLWAPLPAFENFRHALSPLSFHHCVFCLSATFSGLFPLGEFHHCQPIRTSSCIVSFFIIFHPCVFCLAATYQVYSCSGNFTIGSL